MSRYLSESDKVRPVRHCPILSDFGVSTVQTQDCPVAYTLHPLTQSHARARVLPTTLHSDTSTSQSGRGEKQFADHIRFRNLQHTCQDLAVPVHLWLVLLG